MSTLYIFDFDDTLIDSETEIRVNHRDGSTTSMSSEEYAKYVNTEGDVYDFTDFDAYPKNAEVIEPVFAELKSAIAISGTSNVVILTARSNPVPVRLFLKNNNVPNIAIEAVGSSDPKSKALYILQRIKEDNHEEVIVFEDNARNIRTIRKALTDEGVRLTTNRVKNGRVINTIAELRLRSRLLRGTP
jgi:HAD superfamily hydrolase (TIGR01509 family)